jgi:hypothetical protein
MYWVGNGDFEMNMFQHCASYCVLVSKVLARLNAVSYPQFGLLGDGVVRNM